MAAGLLSEVRTQINGEAWLQPIGRKGSFKGGPEPSWSTVARQAETPLQGTEEYVWRAGGKRDSEPGNQLWQGDTQPGVCGTALGKSAVADAVRGADRPRLVSSWAQRVGASLCQQGGLAAGPRGVRPRRGRETVAGLGLRLWAAERLHALGVRLGQGAPASSLTHVPARRPRGARRKQKKTQHARTRKPVSPLTVSLHGENILVLAAKRFFKALFSQSR